MVVQDVRLVGKVTLELEAENWKAKNAKGEWYATDKKAVILRRKQSRSLYEMKFDNEEIPVLISMLQDHLENGE